MGMFLLIRDQIPLLVQFISRHLVIEFFGRITIVWDIYYRWYIVGTFCVTAIYSVNTGYTTFFLGPLPLIYYKLYNFCCNDYSFNT